MLAAMLKATRLFAGKLAFRCAASSRRPVGATCHVYAGLACAALAGACSSEPRVGSTATALDFCKTLGEIAVEKEGQCQSAAPAFINAEKAQSDALCSGVQAEVEAGRAVYDRAKGGSCALTLASLDGCAALSVLEGNLLADCTAALTGAVAPGGQCSSEVMNHCAGGYCSAPIPRCSAPFPTGECVAWLTEGEPCAPPGLCAPGLGCSSATGTVCVAPSGAGGPCPCQAGLYCDSTLTCKAMKTSGSCSGFSECAPGYVCSGSPGSCVPYVGLGASCGATAVCGMGYYCDSGTGKCAALPVVGQPCMLTRAGTTTRLQCVASWCDADGTKICQPRKADGEPCTSQCIFQPCIFDDQCVGYCDTSTQTCAGAGQGLVCVSPP